MAIDESTPEDAVENPDRGNRPPKPLTIGRLARQVGVGAETLRFYEREGLLPPPQRSAGGYRHYDQSAVLHVGFICRAKALGFTLREIRELLDLRHHNNATAGDFKCMVQDKIEEVERKMEDLTRIREALHRLSGTCPGGAASRGDCPILASLEGRPQC
jgi:Cu(I)-responsive transcriptional regulator